MFIQRLNLFFLISLILLLLSSVSSLITVQKQSDVNLTVQIHQTALQKLESLSSEIKQAETSVRGYVITGEKSYLRKYPVARIKAWNVYTEIKKLDVRASDPKRLELLKNLIHQRFITLNKGIGAKNSAKKFPDSLIKAGDRITNQIIDQTEGIKNDRRAELYKNLEHLETLSTYSKVLNVSVALIALVVACVFWKKLRDIYFKSNRQLAIINALPANVAIINKAGVITSVNDSWKKHTLRNGLSGKSYGVGDNYIEASNRAENAGAREFVLGVNAVVKGEADSFALEYPCSSKHGERWFRVIVAPINLIECNEYVIMHVDISELKLSEKQTLMANERFELISKATHDGIWDWNITENSLFLSEGVEKILGMPILDEDTWSQFIHPDDRERVLSTLNDVIIDPDKNTWNETYRFCRPDGSFIHIKDDAFIARDQHRKAVRMVGAKQDITELIDQQLKILKKNQRLREIAVINSHQIRKPLANILGILEVIKYTDSRNLQELLCLLAKSADELDEMLLKIAEISYDEFV
ncbi:MAG: PAS domain-containing protein [Sphingobacteriaceae bacterium]|nr:PAS domain-containing protein [Sphingobacteriaceae bacterium]